MSKDSSSERISEGRGRLPWWAWAAVILWLVYAFFLGPFNWFPPRG